MSERYFIDLLNGFDVQLSLLDQIFRTCDISGDSTTFSKSFFICPTILNGETWSISQIRKRMIYHCAFVRFSPSGSASTSLSKSFGFTHDFFDIIAGSIYHPVGIYILHTYKHNKRTLKIDYRYKKVKNESITRIFLSSKSLSDFPIASFLRTPSLKIHQENFRKVHIRICIRKKSFSRWLTKWVNYTLIN